LEPSYPYTEQLAGADILAASAKQFVSMISKKDRKILSEINTLVIENGAGDEIRTHDPHLGKVMLYP